jgi:predicted DNA-binding transcriptional regulator AlpA
METEQYINDRKASGILDAGTQTLRNWRFQQRGPRYVKMGRSVRYAMSDLLAYMEKRKIDPVTQK